MNVVMLGRAGGEPLFVEVQGTAEGSAFTRGELDPLLGLARASTEIMALQPEMVAEPPPARVRRCDGSAAAGLRLGQPGQGRRDRRDPRRRVELLPRPAAGPTSSRTPTRFGNARLKAVAICAATGQPAVADDTGLFVDALDGAPGVSRRATPARGVRTPTTAPTACRAGGSRRTAPLPSAGRSCAGPMGASSWSTACATERSPRGAGRWRLRLRRGVRPRRRRRPVVRRDDRRREGRRRRPPRFARFERSPRICGRNHPHSGPLCSSVTSRAGRSPSSSTSSPRTSHAVSCRAIVGSMCAGTTLHPGADRHAVLGTNVTCSSLQNSTSAASIDGLPWSMPSALRPTSATAPRRRVDHRAEHGARLAERQVQAGVGGVHQRVAAGLHLADPGWRSYVPVPPDETMSPPTLAGRRGGSRSPARPWRAVAALDDHQVALVAHRAAHVRAPGPWARSARRPASSGGQPQRGRPMSTSISTSSIPAAAAASIVSGESTATVIRAPSCRSAIRARRVGSSVSLASNRSSPTPAVGHPDHLARCGAGERRGGRVPGRGQRGALVRLDVRAQRAPGRGRGHRRQVVVQRVDVDQQRRRGQVVTFM